MRFLSMVVASGLMQQRQARADEDAGTILALEAELAGAEGVAEALQLELSAAQGELQEAEAQLSRMREEQSLAAEAAQLRQAQEAERQAQGELASASSAQEAMDRLRSEREAASSSSPSLPLVLGAQKEEVEAMQRDVERLRARSTELEAQLDDQDAVMQELVSEERGREGEG